MQTGRKGVCFVPFYSTSELHSSEFNQRFFFDGELGALHSPEGTTFRLWAPTSWSATLVLHTGPAAGSYAMTLGDRGVREHHAPGDLSGSEYTYKLVFTINAEPVESVDPYARAVTANGERGVVVNVAALLGVPQRLPSFGQASDAIIYELHVRDCTIGPDNGITHKGKFLGLTEAGTTTKAGNPSGLDYIADLGVTHVQLLPVFDFGSVDETGDLGFNAQYNWGYDPLHYNVPEGSYATDPTNPTARLTEFRQLVDAFHARGIRVIMDVVYNHVHAAEHSPLERTVPGYFFRMTHDGHFHNGTGCGNETASEQLMMRKYIVDSVVYWVKTFGLDGFRFDLMGIHDVDTINAVRAALDEIDPGIIVIGEGWDMGNHPAGVMRAHQGNSPLMPRVGFFNDFYRDIVKGSNFSVSDPGFVSGCVGSYDCSQSNAGSLYDALLGSPANRNFLTADQSVLYNEAHDNWTMFDKLRGTHTLVWASEADITKRHTLATSTQFVGRGVVFIHAGQEFLRTKNGDENSYRSPDSVNVFDYDRAAKFAAEVQYFKELNAFRKAHAWLREADYEVIKKNSHLITAEGLHLSYRVTDAFGPGHDAWVLVNANYYHWSHPVPAGTYKVHVNDGHGYEKAAQVELSHEFVVPPLRLVVLERIA